MKLNLKIWRQKGPNDKGQLVTYPVNNVSEDMSFLEMLDVLNDDLVRKGDASANVMLMPGDTIIIPESRF